MDSSRIITREYSDYLQAFWEQEEKAKAEKQFVDFMVDEMDPVKFEQRKQADMEEVMVDIEEVERLNRNVKCCEGSSRRAKIWNGRAG